MHIIADRDISTVCSELLRVLFLALSVNFFCLCMKCLGNCWMDLCQIHRKDMFGPSLGRVWMSRSQVMVSTDKRWGFGGYLWNCWTDLRQIHMEDMFGPSLGRVWSISAACMQFMFRETSLL